MSAHASREPVEVVERDGRRRTIVDLSDVLSNATADFEPLRHSIEYMTAEEGAERPFHGLEPEFQARLLSEDHFVRAVPEWTGGPQETSLWG